MLRAEQSSQQGERTPPCLDEGGLGGGADLRVAGLEAVCPVKHQGGSSGKTRLGGRQRRLGPCDCLAEAHRKDDCESMLRAIEERRAHFSHSACNYPGSCEFHPLAGGDLVDPHLAAAARLRARRPLQRQIETPAPQRATSARWRGSPARHPTCPGRASPAPYPPTTVARRLHVVVRHLGEPVRLDQFRLVAADDHEVGVGAGG